MARELRSKRRRRDPRGRRRRRRGRRSSSRRSRKGLRAGDQLVAARNADDDRDVSEGGDGDDNGGGSRAGGSRAGTRPGPPVALNVRDDRRVDDAAHRQPHGQRAHGAWCGSYWRRAHVAVDEPSLGPKHARASYQCSLSTRASKSHFLFLSLSSTQVRQLLEEGNVRQLLEEGDVAVDEPSLGPKHAILGVLGLSNLSVSLHPSLKPLFFLSFSLSFPNIRTPPTQVRQLLEEGDVAVDEPSLGPKYAGATALHPGSSSGAHSRHGRTAGGRRQHRSAAPAVPLAVSPHTLAGV
ncbi:unnamed protein product, partial [Closterium sp. Naga37s-1]